MWPFLASPVSSKRDVDRQHILEKKKQNKTKQKKQQKYYHPDGLNHELFPTFANDHTLKTKSWSK